MNLERNNFPVNNSQEKGSLDDVPFFVGGQGTHRGGPFHDAPPEFPEAGPVPKSAGIDAAFNEIGGIIGLYGNR